MQHSVSTDVSKNTLNRIGIFEIWAVKQEFPYDLCHTTITILLCPVIAVI